MDLSPLFLLVLALIASYFIGMIVGGPDMGKKIVKFEIGILGFLGKMFLTLFLKAGEFICKEALKGLHQKPKKPHSHHSHHP
ncbi:MAG: hypothetical protein FJY98_02470 [Candidatus Liptonbacteria bacterium]|nr:hypothetical protein [Candidatus Liptonbacteria bacterium]